MLEDILRCSPPPRPHRGVACHGVSKFSSGSTNTSMNSYTVAQQGCWGDLLIPSILCILSFMSHKHGREESLLLK